jgi:hypothetical protein
VDREHSRTYLAAASQQQVVSAVSSSGSCRGLVSGEAIDKPADGFADATTIDYPTGWCVMTLPAKRPAFRIPTKYRFIASRDERSHDARSSVGGQQAAVTIPNDGELAWRLAAEITGQLRDVDRVSIYLKIGCGDHYEAIVQMLELVSRHRMQLSASTEACLPRWAGGYADTAYEHAIRGLLERGRAPME